MKELKAEAPAIGILKTHDFGDSMYYTIVCQCGNLDDMIDFSVELEADSQNIVLATIFTPKTAYWNRLVNSSNNSIEADGEPLVRLCSKTEQRTRGPIFS